MAAGRSSNNWLAAPSPKRRTKASRASAMFGLRMPVVCASLDTICTSPIGLILLHSAFCVVSFVFVFVFRVFEARWGH
jgi:hypothetical protein